MTDVASKYGVFRRPRQQTWRGAGRQEPLNVRYFGDAIHIREAEFTKADGTCVGFGPRVLSSGP